MKKQFFYAALAIGMMSSCTSSDLPGNQAPEEQLPEEERVAIELGISSPNAKIEASTKGIGSVGGTGVTGDENNWKGEALGIWMYKVEDGALSKAIEPGTTDTYIFDGLDFKAPSTGDKGQIEIFQTGSTTHQVKYYPSTGKFAFYGYHIDDAGESATPDYDNRKITGLKIDGTQDIMAALTLPVNADNYGDAEEPVGSSDTQIDWDKCVAQSFSAWAARRGIQPILNFEHKLARLRFFVKAGDAPAAAKEWDGSTWQDRLADLDGNGEPETTKAVQITSITIDDLQSALDLSFVTETSEGVSVEKSKLTPSEVPNTTYFTLMSPNTDPSSAELIALIPQAPTYWSHAGAGSQADGTNYKEKDQVGATMMFLPWTVDDTNDTKKKLTLKIGVKQAVLDTYGTNESDNPTYILKSDEMTTTLDATKVKINDSSYATAFEAGKSYDVTIIVYSYQRIEIEAKLSKWENGGSIEVAPGDEF